MPSLLAAGLLACSERATDLAAMETVRELLVAGELLPEERVALDQAVDRLAGSPWVKREARTARWIAEAFGARPELPPADELPLLDADAFPLSLITRAAFERGNFDAALHLAALSERLGGPDVEVVKTAALIETGRGEDARRNASQAGLVVPAVAGGDGDRLAVRVRRHLQRPEPGVLLLDRRGRELGHLVDGEIVPADGVHPTLLPPAVLDAAAEHPGAGSLYLTLDLELAEAARRAFGRFRGSIVLVDPATGDVLAAVSDRRTFAREDGRAPFEQMREPASISKLITTAAYLREGGDPEARLRHERCRGHEVYAGERLYCPVIAGPLRGLDRAMAVSCNVAFADLGVEAGRDAVVDELRRWGFDGSLGPFPAGRILRARGDARQLADLSIGLQDSEITPLHAALLAATVARSGERPAPRLVAAVDGRLGLHPRPLPAAPAERVIEEAWARELGDAMETVASRGTAMRVRTRGFPVAMKTGTASDPRWGFHVNYVGYGPLPEARVAFAVRITDRPTSRHVRYAAVEVTARLLRGLRHVARERGWNEGVETDPPPFRTARRGGSRTLEMPASP